MKKAFNESRVKSPTSLEAFSKAFAPDEHLMWKSGFYRQVRDFKMIQRVFGMEASVISIHTSKSVDLPVVEYIKGENLSIVVRDNFHNVIMSVESRFELDFLPLEQKKEVHPVYCEGFKEEWVHERYSDNNRQFTANLNTMEELFSVLGAIEANIKMKEAGI